MSYILEGLKKQAEENEAPLTASSPLNFEEPGVQQRSTNWPYWIAALVLGNLVGLGAWVYIENSVITPFSKQPQRQQTITSQTKAPTTNSAQEKTSSIILPHHTLPTKILQQLPKLKIAAHIYDKSPEKRMVMINGQLLTEGTSLDKKVHLEKIGPQKIILRFNKYRFSIAI